MKENVVSVIVPVYNVEQYLNQCIESILNQSFSNLELILVDDGSTDKRVPIAEIRCENHDEFMTHFMDNFRGRI